MGTVLKSSNVTNRGHVMSVENYKGVIKLSSNTFKYTYSSLSDCANIETNFDDTQLESSSSTNTYYLDTPFYSGDFLMYQHHSLISIVNPYNAVQLISNTFSYNTATYGIVFISLPDRPIYYATSYALIYGNTFSYNGGYSSVGSNALKLVVNETSFDTPSSSSKALCGGFTVSNNNFNYNYGCYRSHGAIHINCNDNSQQQSLITTSQTNRTYWLQYAKGQTFISSTKLSSMYSTSPGTTSYSVSDTSSGSSLSINTL